MHGGIADLVKSCGGSNKAKAYRQLSDGGPSGRARETVGTGRLSRAPRRRCSEDQYYDMQLFENDELLEYFDRLVTVRHPDKTLYDHVVVDSETIERRFAEDLGREVLLQAAALL
jgi:hypothetical protein